MGGAVVMSVISAPELQRVQARIEAAGGQQLGVLPCSTMRPASSATMRLGALDGREAVRDDEAGAPLHQRLERLLHQPLAIRSRAPRSPRRGSGSARPCRSRGRSRGAGAARPRAGCRCGRRTLSMPSRQAVDEVEQVGRAQRRARPARGRRSPRRARRWRRRVSLNSDDVLADERELAPQRLPRSSRRAARRRAARGRRSAR